MSTNKIIPMKPRHQVPRAIEYFSGRYEDYDGLRNIPLFLDGAVTCAKLAKVLLNNGFRFRFDSTNHVLIIITAPPSPRKGDRS